VSTSDLPLMLVLAADVVLCTGMVIYRKPLAGWSVARSRCWRNRPHAQRINEACILLGAVLGLGMSVFILYDTYVVQPRFRQRMEDLMRLPPAPPPSHLR
jgi:hypothetical protein